MVNLSSELSSLSTRIDRYPAKMISRLASSLVERYAQDAEHLLDPFCGSGAVLRAGNLRGLRVTGIDVNPFGILLSNVKLHGFDMTRAMSLCETLIESAYGGSIFPIEWDRKEYWFTKATLRKFEQIRYTAQQMNLQTSMTGQAILLALGLSVRLCSRADQRSPKPFISKYARKNRIGKHYDPGSTMLSLLRELCELYGRQISSRSQVHQLDMTDENDVKEKVKSCSHVITSPPYINAQDYFRNSKLELYMLEGLLPFKVSDIINRFIGTERGLERGILTEQDADNRRRLVPELEYLEKHRIVQAVIVHRYLRDMTTVFHTIRSLIQAGGTFVIVCGDNLIGGRQICTWQVLNRMLEELGFTLFDSFGDQIKNRAVAPMRCGHKGLIKQEIISAFRLAQCARSKNFDMGSTL